MTGLALDRSANGVLVERRCVDLRKEMLRCDTFVGKSLAGERSEGEGQILALFITERAMPFVEFWRRTFDLPCF